MFVNEHDIELAILHAELSLETTPNLFSSYNYIRLYRLSYKIGILAAPQTFALDRQVLYILDITAVLFLQNYIVLLVFGVIEVSFVISIDEQLQYKIFYNRAYYFPLASYATSGLFLSSEII